MAPVVYITVTLVSLLFVVMSLAGLVIRRWPAAIGLVLIVYSFTRPLRGCWKRDASMTTKHGCHRQASPIVIASFAEAILLPSVIAITKRPVRKQSCNILRRVAYKGCEINRPTVWVHKASFRAAACGETWILIRDRKNPKSQKCLETVHAKHPPTSNAQFVRKPIKNARLAAYQTTPALTWIKLIHNSIAWDNQNHPRTESTKSRAASAT